LKAVIVLNEHNTVFDRCGPLYATGVFWAHQSRWCKQHLDRFSRFCRVHQVTDQTYAALLLSFWILDFKPCQFPRTS